MENWIEFNHKEVWEESTGRKGYLSISFKRFFNNLYQYIFPDLTKHVDEIIKKSFQTESSV
jgi:hypothetical protein